MKIPHRCSPCLPFRRKGGLGERPSKMMKLFRLNLIEKNLSGSFEEKVGSGAQCVVKPPAKGKQSLNYGTRTTVALTLT